MWLTNQYIDLLEYRMGYIYKQHYEYDILGLSSNGDTKCIAICLW